MTGANTGPGIWEQVTCADGKPIARCDNVEAVATVTQPPDYCAFTIHPGWQAEGDSSLVGLGPVGDVITRFTITPSADTSIATTIATAKG